MSIEMPQPIEMSMMSLLFTNTGVFNIKSIKKICPLAFQQVGGGVCVIMLLFTFNKCLDTVGCFVLHKSWNIKAPTRALFNYFLSFCPIALHCESFNYTIHHLLNMKNSVKRLLIKPHPKVFCKGPVNQANGLRGLRFFLGGGFCMYVCCFSFFLSLSLRCHSFYLIHSSMPMEAPCLWKQVLWINFNGFACCSLCVVCFCSGSWDEVNGENMAHSHPILVV